MSVRLKAAQTLVASAANGARRDAQRAEKRAAEAQEAARKAREDRDAADEVVGKLESAEAVLSD